MRIGVVYPQDELEGDPDAVRRFGRAVEELGFDHLSAHEHVLGVVYADDRAPGLYEGPYTERDPYHDPFVMFAHLAAITERIEFATGILVLPLRQTALLARQAADLDLFSGGRLRLGVGAGWNHVEFEALGQDFRTRGPRQEEQIELLRRLFTEPVVDYSGRFHRIDRAALTPRPVRPIPIWLGGSSKTAYDRAARLADGFIFDNAQGIGHNLGEWNRLRERLDRAGRSVPDFGREYVAGPTGNVRDLPAQFDAWREAGGTHATVSAAGVGLAGVEGHIEYLAAAADALGLR
jgi:probable F420-dependent oxidoreductase